MGAGQELYDRIKSLAGALRYRIRSHAVRHMIEEGFAEQDIIQILSGRGRILEDYPDESRCLILGYYSISEAVRCPLHVVCDYSAPNLLDIVTAYMPEKPWWDSPTKRGRTQ